MKLYLAQSVSPAEFGENYLIEGRNKVNAIRRINRLGREVIKVRKITEQKADEMIINGKIFAYYNA